MDRIRTHRHSTSGNYWIAGGGLADGGGYWGSTPDVIGDPIAAIPNLNRHGKTTDPRSVAVNIYTWAQVYVP
jgi:hypothetical protein